MVSSNVEVLEGGWEIGWYVAQTVGADVQLEELGEVWEGCGAQLEESIAREVDVL